MFKKSLLPRIFATHRRKIDSYQELFNLCPNIIGPEMYRLGCECPAPEYCFTVEYNEEYGVDIDIEFVEAVAERKEDSELIKFKELPEVPVALCVNHYGAYEHMPETFAELLRMPRQMDTRSLTVPGFAILTAFGTKKRWMNG